MVLAGQAQGQPNVFANAFRNDMVEKGEGEERGEGRGEEKGKG
jgi:hypothetical protein